MDTSGVSHNVMKTDDSVFSVAGEIDSPSLIKHSNPFGVDKNNLIKKINTEAYLGVPSNAVARFAASQ